MEGTFTRVYGVTWYIAGKFQIPQGNIRISSRPCLDKLQDTSIAVDSRGSFIGNKGRE
jgi:hypothetical protein